MGNTHCIIVNNTDKVIDVQVFNFGDNKCGKPHRTYCIPPGKSVRGKAGRALYRRGVKVGVIFNQWASSELSGGPGCKFMVYCVQQGKTLSVLKMDKNYREESDEEDLKPHHVDDSTFVLCQGYQKVEKHGDFWYKKAAYSWGETELL
jgi:hypothetical protein